MRIQLVQNNEKYFITYVNTGIQLDRKQNTYRSLNRFGVIESGHKLENMKLSESLNLQPVSSLKNPSPN